MANKTIDNLQEFTSPLTDDDLFIMYDVEPPAQGDENYSDTANTKKVTLDKLTEKLSDTFGSPYEYIQENLEKQSIKFNNMSNIATGTRSVAEGNSTVASGNNSHAEGNSTSASGNNSHAEGMSTWAMQINSHAEGQESNAQGAISHAEGLSTIANGMASHAEGSQTEANGTASHAQGISTIANGDAQTAIGKYNIRNQDNGLAFIIGNGDSNLARHNALAVAWNGTILASGSINGLTGITSSGQIDFLNAASGVRVPTIGLTNSVANNSTYAASTGFVQNLVADKISPINTKIGSDSIDNYFISRFGANNLLDAIKNLDTMQIIINTNHAGPVNNRTYMSQFLLPNYSDRTNRHIRWAYFYPPEGHVNYRPADAPVDTATYWYVLTIGGRFQIARPVNNQYGGIYIRGVGSANGVYTIGNWYLINSTIVNS